MPDFAEFMEEIKELWDSKWLTNRGKKAIQLETELNEYLDTSNIALFTNGHLALEYIMEALNLTGEVITTPFTFASTTHAIVRRGLTPVFCDINFNDYTIQTDLIESLITEKTSAIIPVHVYGNICNANEIERIAKKYHLKVIYDAAHAFGVTVNGKGVGNYGDASMFSFHATKVFNTIEGGALTFNDPTMKEVLNSYMNFGITGTESVEYVGGNAKMNEFQAAMGLCNLRHVDQEIEKRKRVYHRYLENLSGLKGVTLPSQKNDIKSNYAYFPVLFEDFYHSRDDVYNKLMENNIFSRKYFYPLTNHLDCYRGQFSAYETPIAQYVSDRILTLPLYADLTVGEVDKICEIISTP